MREERSDRVDGEDDAQTFEEALADLADGACNLLVVGAVPPAVTATATQRLFGESSPDQRRLLVRTHGSLDHSDCLEEGATPGQVEVLRHVLPSRSAAVSPDPHPAETRVETNRLSDLGRSVSDRILEYTRAASDPSTQDVYVCFDSLDDLLAEYDAEPVFRFVNMMAGQIGNVGGMGQFHLPVPLDSEAVALLAPVFDAVVELRVVDGELQQRWHLADGRVSSDWQPLESPEETLEG